LNQPTPYHTAHGATLYLGDCLDILPTLPDTSIDAIVTDPPYGLAEHSAATIQQALTAWMAGDRSHVPTGKGFMGKDWDAFVPPPAVWDECLRVLKPGGHLVAFAGSRTVDLMGLAIRLAGFELRESLMWVHGQGFPKSLDVSKAIDKAAGADREVIGNKLDRPGYHLNGHDSGTGALGRGISATTPETRFRAAQITAPATEAAARWQGFGTALKPAHEPIILARRPLEGTVAGNVLTHGTGALNIDGCRVAHGGDLSRYERSATSGFKSGGVYGGGEPVLTPAHAAGRWPTNVVLTHPPLLDDHGQPIGDACADGCVPGCPVAEMDAQSGNRPGFASQRDLRTTESRYFGADKHLGERSGYGDQGGASRFFSVFRYQAKAPSKERPRLPDGTAHPTVKPLSLMSWLSRLVCPPGGTVLEPFAGSGATLEACVREGFTVIGIERHEPYAELCRVRLSKPIDAALFGDVA
jgi:site-specific DNA-methyltransferase (adenine-specific)